MSAMSHLDALLQHHPGHAFATQYVLAETGWNSFLSFHNYYDEVFPGKRITARLHLVFHDPDGRETLNYEVDIAPGGVAQIDCRKLGIRVSGIVAMAAVPAADLTKLAEGKFKIRSHIGTGFYITWERQGRWRDMMHEWTDVVTNESAVNVQHVGFAASNQPVDYGMVLMNPSIAPSSGLPIALTLRTDKGHQVGRTAEMQALPAMGSRIASLSEIFADFTDLLGKHRRLVVSVASRNHSPPLTAEWHRSGDFHLHHI